MLQMSGRFPSFGPNSSNVLSSNELDLGLGIGRRPRLVTKSPIRRRGRTHCRQVTRGQGTLKTKRPGSQSPQLAVVEGRLKLDYQSGTPRGPGILHWLRHWRLTVEAGNCSPAVSPAVRRLVLSLSDCRRRNLSSPRGTSPDGARKTQHAPALAAPGPASTFRLDRRNSFSEKDFAHR